MKTSTTMSVLTLLLAVFMWVIPTDTLAQRRGGSFGGSRSSGRSFSSPRSGGSFGGRRSAPSSAPRSAPRSGSSSRGSNYSPSRPTERNTNTFGGARINRPQDYTSRYGTPRAQSRESFRTNGTTTNYVVNRYGGMGDGFMMGYLMGSIPWYYHMPFHPAYYYSHPTTVVNPDGTTGVYPGTFQFGTLFFTLLIVGALCFIIYVIIRNRRRRVQGYSSMQDGSQSSFS